MFIALLLLHLQHIFEVQASLTFATLLPLSLRLYSKRCAKVCKFLLLYIRVEIKILLKRIRLYENYFNYKILLIIFIKKYETEHQ